jgi:hypothetical protein
MNSVPVVKSIQRVTCRRKEQDCYLIEPYLYDWHRITDRNVSRPLPLAPAVRHARCRVRSLFLSFVPSPSGMYRYWRRWAD